MKRLKVSKRIKETVKRAELRISAFLVLILTVETRVTV